MYTHIEENIYSIFVPLPGNPLKNLNAYLIKSESGRNLLIDTGFRQDECRQALLAGLDELGVSMENTDIFLTHMHSDHTGLAAELAAPETRVYINREDGDRLESFRVAKNTLRMEEYSMLGFSREEMDFLQDSPMRKFSSVKKAEFTHISDGDTLEYGGRRLRVIETPGHTPGHVCLYDRENKVMFLGDHVLFDITPNITTWQGFEDPLNRATYPWGREDDDLVGHYRALGELRRRNANALRGTLRFLDDSDLTVFERVSEGGKDVLRTYYNPCFHTIYRDVNALDAFTGDTVDTLAIPPLSACAVAYSLN